MITDDAVKFVTGIENIEVFLEENDEWQFHFFKSNRDSLEQREKTRMLKVPNVLAKIVIDHVLQK